jgi:hypothetical protein
MPLPSSNSFRPGFDFEPEVELGHDVRNAGVVGEPLDHLDDFVLDLGHV